MASEIGKRWKEEKENKRLKRKEKRINHPKEGDS